MSYKNSIVQYIGPSQSSSCGYCKKKGKKRSIGTNDAEGPDEVPAEETAYNFGVIAHFLSPEHFNQILDIGWSRSGQYLYKPVMEKTCCPQYTIRSKRKIFMLEIEKFRVSRTQKRVLKTMIDFLKSDKRPSRKVVEEDNAASAVSSQQQVRKDEPMRDARTHGPLTNGAASEKGAKPFSKKKVIRRQRAEDRLRQKGIDIEQYKAERLAKEEARRRTLESFINLDDTNGWAHQLEIRLVQQGTPEFEATFDESFSVYQKYQQTIHSDKDCTRRGYERHACAHNIFNNHVFSFLVSSPLYNVDEITPALGSYHQQYVLDGRIIAVGVIDILPRCLSSKYFYYDPDYKFLTLGTYSALREIAFTRELSQSRPELKYYYMGYYLQNCPKMRYKGKFRPSDLLCDKTFQWVPLDECAKMIRDNDGKFTVFRPDDPEPPKVPVDDVRCMVKDTVMTFRELRQMLPNAASLSAKLEEYTRYAGPLAQRMILYL
ncbi:arginine-tRNA-protein transferase [Aphelenchoides avenae]|nr:arginine-tRNA-protein transferase [Aphelenchus avenae]